jgi:hypothetical protein
MQNGCSRNLLSWFEQRMTDKTMVESERRGSRCSRRSTSKTLSQDTQAGQAGWGKRHGGSLILATWYSTYRG